MSSRPCAVHGCPELKPCPNHPERRSSATWSGRNRETQRRYRTQVLQRDNNTCTRCGHHDPTGQTLQAHHWRPSDNPAHGTTLCRTCHKILDPHAR